MTDWEEHLVKVEVRNKKIKNIISLFVLLVAFGFGVSGLIKVWPEHKEKESIVEYETSEEDAICCAESSDCIRIVSSGASADAITLMADTGGIDISLASDEIDISCDGCDAGEDILIIE